MFQFVCFLSTNESYVRRSNYEITEGERNTGKLGKRAIRGEKIISCM